MQDDFEFTEHYAGRAILVRVRKTTVLLHEEGGLVLSGIWDPGRYVRYARSHLSADLVHPFLLDKIDKTLRERVKLPGVPAARIDPPGNARHR